MSPPYLFRIDEIQRDMTAPYRVDPYGRWMPSTSRGAHITVHGGISGRLWYCDGVRICQIPSVPSEARQYKTCSLYFLAGWGFWVLGGDATNPMDDENWHPLRFQHSQQDYSSYLTNAGDQSKLCIQRPDQTWPRCLLPDIYHAPFEMAYPQCGGLIGELPILLALVAFTTTRETLATTFPNYFFNAGKWTLHPEFCQPRETDLSSAFECFAKPVSGTDRRGVVVTVYTCPSTYAGGSTAHDLEQYENGIPCKYFD